MSARVGIELSPSACRIVELEPARLRGRDPRTTRVRSFRILPPSGDETRAAFAQLRGRTAAVVVWNAFSEHRQVAVAGGTYESMRAEALASLAAAGIATQGVAADIAPVAGRPRHGVRQPVVVATASSADLTAALQPLRDAGIRLRSVTTPAAALTSIARQRREFSAPGTIEAYIALEPAVTCLALVRDAMLVAAYTLGWGYVDAETGRARPREEIASHLAESIVDCVTAAGGGARDIGQVCVCGAVPELRSMTLPLMEALDVEVEPLDSLFGIDAAALPAPADEFRERSCELRLAWAAAADWPAPINLLRGQRRRTSKALLMRAAVAAGVAAGLAVGWRVSRSDVFRSTAPRPATQARARPPAAPTRAATAPETPAATTGRTGPVARPVPPDAGPQIPAAVLQIRHAFVPPPDAGPQIPAALLAARRGPASPSSAPARPANPPAPQPGSAPPPSVVARVTGPVPPVRSDASSSQADGRASAAPPSTQPLTAVASAGARAASAPAVPPVERARVRNEPAPPVRREPSPPPVRTEPAASPLRTAPAAPAVRSEPAAPAARAEPSPPRLLTRPPVVTTTDRPAPARAEGAARPPAARGSQAPAEVPLPFDGVLGTILYSPDRRLAIVDGRIVGIGDQVRDARVVDITASAVLLRDAQGRLRRLSMSAGAR